MGVGGILWLANCCEHGDELSGSIKCGKLKCYLIKKPHLEGSIGVSDAVKWHCAKDNSNTEQV
jgi:hypothetical protein